MVNQCDGAGFECERLFDPYADPAGSAYDRQLLETACRELMSISREYQCYTDTKQVMGTFQRLASHLLQPHTDAMGYLAGRMASKMDWNGGDMHESLLLMYPHYRGHKGLFDRDHWYAGWLSLLEDFDRADEARFQRFEDVRQRLHQRFGRGW